MKDYSDSKAWKFLSLIFTAALGSLFFALLGIVILAFYNVKVGDELGAYVRKFIAIGFTITLIYRIIVPAKPKTAEIKKTPRQTPYSGPYPSSGYTSSPTPLPYVTPVDTSYDDWKANHDKEVKRSNDHWNETNLGVLRSKSELSDSDRSRKEELEREEINRMFRND